MNCSHNHVTCTFPMNRIVSQLVEQSKTLVYHPGIKGFNSLFAKSSIIELATISAYYERQNIVLFVKKKTKSWLALMYLTLPRLVCLVIAISAQLSMNHCVLVLVWVVFSCCHRRSGPSWLVGRALRGGRGSRLGGHRGSGHPPSPPPLGQKFQRQHGTNKS